MKPISEKDVILLATRQIDEEEYLKRADISSEELPVVVFQYIKHAVAERDANALECGMALMAKFDISNIDDQFAQVLIEAMEGDWHTQHEEIALTFEFDPKPQYVDTLYKNTQTAYKYLDYDDSYALAVKCIWALGKVGTALAKEKLEFLAQSENDVIKKNANYQLELLAK